MGFNEAFRQVKQLVKDFEENKNFYLSAAYQEIDVRRDFIDNFFIALGWDVLHKEQKNPYLQEVRVERKVTVQSARSQKRADYSFFISPKFKNTDIKFFVEAKKPSKDLTNKDYFFQTVRYGWNAQTPIAVLTDFEEFIILDCRFKPDIDIILSTEIERFHFLDYSKEDKFRKIFHLFSRESVASESLIQYSESLEKPKGKAVQFGLFSGAYKTIDDSFLEDLDQIRDTLARSFKKNNSDLTGEELTEAIQKTIDRLVFIRFLEDKLIEPEPILNEFGNSKSPWLDFISASKKLDRIYNGAVFKESKIDSDQIEPDDTVFLSICDELSDLNSPYLFDIFSFYPFSFFPIFI